ncbi:MAG: lipoyl(octanoyl) transferase LipB [Chitinophagaceae bacterium]|nr:lipoyl(octanoyl) transferase LipB [Chitinophagaceae bacterium]
MKKQEVIFDDLGIMEYQRAWDYQESLLNANVLIKSAVRSLQLEGDSDVSNIDRLPPNPAQQTTHYFLFVEHPPVYTLGKSGHMENILINEEERIARGIQFFKINRGGDITFHGPGQIVGYPILDLEKFDTDIGKYLRNIEEVIIFTLAEYGIKGERSKGETGVWIDAGISGKERKICAIGVRCSRWITMHGFAFNVNTDLDYFNYIIPCGIRNKKVTSLQKELGRDVAAGEVKKKIKRNFLDVFQVTAAAVKNVRNL